MVCHSLMCYKDVEFWKRFWTLNYNISWSKMCRCKNLINCKNLTKMSRFLSFFQTVLGKEWFSNKQTNIKRPTKHTINHSNQSINSIYLSTCKNSSDPDHYMHGIELWYHETKLTYTCVDLFTFHNGHQETIECDSWCSWQDVFENWEWRTTEKQWERMDISMLINFIC